MRHSTITNPDDLHYAKARTFTGEPSAVSPNFVNQILVRTDTQEQFISTGTTAGALLKLSEATAPPPATASSNEWIVSGTPASIEIGKRYIIADSFNPLIFIPTTAPVGSSIILYSLDYDLNIEGASNLIDLRSIAGTGYFDQVYTLPKNRTFELIYIGAIYDSHWFLFAR